MQDGYENALEGDTDLDKKVVKLGELNELYYVIKRVCSQQVLRPIIQQSTEFVIYNIKNTHKKILNL